MTSASLSELPAELVQEIQYLLPYPSRLALRFTCRALYFKTDEPRSDSDYKMSDLLEIETWPRYNDAAQRPDLKQPIAGLDFFACAQCLRIRSAICFSNAMMKGKRGKAGPVKDRCGRICINCGVAKGIYRKNHAFQYGGAWVTDDMGGVGSLCQYCGEFHSVYLVH